MHSKKTVKDEPYLSIIIAVYNEEKRLHNLEKICLFLALKKFKTELIIIDDGSNDETVNILKRLAKKFRFSLLANRTNMGKGFSIKKGMLAAHGKYRLFTDIDLSVPIEECDKTLSYAKKYPVVIGSRRVKGAKIATHQPFIREFMGRAFSWFSKIILGLSIADFTCGFKCFSAKAAEELFSRVTINRWGFDTELLFIAKRKGYSVYEVPVLWRNDPFTKVRFPQDIIRSFLDLIAIRLNSARGKYK